MTEMSVLQKLLRQGQRIHGLLMRPMTLGVRAIALDEAGRVFLVRHTYIPGFFLPGGGVERGETALLSLERELAEEGGLEMTEPAKPSRLLLQPAPFASRPCRALSASTCGRRRPGKPDWEIAESGFYAARRPSRRRHGLHARADRRIFER